MGMRHTCEQGPMQTQGNDPGGLRWDEGETGCAPGAGKCGRAGCTLRVKLPCSYVGDLTGGWM